MNGIDMALTENEIKIVAEPTTEPDVCRFIVAHEISPGRNISCRDKDTAQGAPLLEALFNIDGIREVLVSGNIVTVAKNTDESWLIIGKIIGDSIRNILRSAKPPIPSDWQRKSPGESFIRNEVEKILTSRINPGVSTHGGRVELVEVKGTEIYLRFAGGCQGCGAANVTLKQGIEKAIRSRIPEITNVIDITDHASGKNPYYTNPRSDGSPFQR
jgi:Fe-S cluster biogenesis protein NfuA